MSPSRAKPKAILVRPRIYIGEAIAIGPGKVDLLRLIGELQSISAAARALRMPYKRAWLLIEALNDGFGRPVVSTATGGKGGGGASLTALGQQLVAVYDALEKRLNGKAAPELQVLRKLASPPAR